MSAALFVDGAPTPQPRRNAHDLQWARMDCDGCSWPPLSEGPIEKRPTGRKEAGVARAAALIVGFSSFPSRLAVC